MADERRQRFFAKFAPQRIFERAGIYELFELFFANASAADGRATEAAQLAQTTPWALPPNASDTAPGQPHGTLSNAVLATVDLGGTMKAAQFLPFVCSFLVHVTDARLVLFVRPPSAIDAFRAAMPPEPQRIELLPWPLEHNATRWSQIFRYGVYADHVEGPSGAGFNKVAVSDAADVAFQADPFEHNAHFVEELALLAAAAAHHPLPRWTPLGLWSGGERIIYCDASGAPHQPKLLPIARTWRALFPKRPLPLWLGFSPGACFAVSRDALLQRLPLSLVETALTDECALSGDVDPIAGHVFERLWMYFFMDDDEIARCPWAGIVEAS